MVLESHCRRSHTGLWWAVAAVERKAEIAQAKTQRGWSGGGAAELGTGVVPTARKPGQ